MDTALLFRKRTPLTEDGLPWLRGGEEHPFTAARNTSGSATLSAILARALLAALDGMVQAATHFTSGVYANVTSKSRPGVSSSCWLDWSANRCGCPHGDDSKVTYHLGVLGVIEALARPDEASDFLKAYAALLHAYRLNGKSPNLREPLCRAADELYYWLQYGPGHSPRLDNLAIGPNVWHETGSELHNLNALTDPDALEEVTGTPLDERPLAAEPATVEPAPGGFVGWQAQALDAALQAGENALLAGPTGTGKTYALQLAVRQSIFSLVTVEGKEGLTDLDFLGAILPQPDNTRRWVDGPLLRAMRLAQHEPVLLFLDELTRVPRVHLNLLLGLMNPKDGETCRKMGLQMDGAGPFYLIEIPLTSEIVGCPAAHLCIVAAGNFGRAYEVYPLDPAVRRRFDTVIEFEYLDYANELALLRREVSALSERVAQALVKLAQETRRLMGNGELPGCVDTASLLNWGRKCARMGGESTAAVIQAARLTWADTVCGRDHTGRVHQGSLQALQDYLDSLKALP